MNKYSSISFGLIIGVLLIGALLLFMNIYSSQTSDEAGFSDLVLAQRPGILPEGIEYDKTNRRLLLSSVAEGTVFEVKPNGTVISIVEDTDLISSFGIEVDEAGNRLLVTNSDFAVFSGAMGQAKLGIYNLTTGKRLRMIDLAAVDRSDASNFLANDVTIDEVGNIYVTDSLARLVYKVDTNGDPSILVPNDQFADIENHFLNGIEYNPEGYLLVGESRNGIIYRIPVDDPKSLTEVQLPEPMIGADGMIWDPNGHLIIVSSTMPRAVALSSEDGWQSGQIEGIAIINFDGAAQTAALVNDDVYVIHGHFGEEVDSYEIERVAFDD